MRIVRNLLIATLVTAVATWTLVAAWAAIGGDALSIHGWIALSIGVFGVIALTWSLMALAFRSSRDGWDDRADEIPARDDRP
jgi:drug/metabolite transporter (DMT)-like permease